MLTTPLPLTYNSSINRAIPVRNYSSLFNLTIPSAFGGFGTATTYTASILTVYNWTVNLVLVNETVLSVEVTATANYKVNDCLFTIFFLGANMAGAPVPPPPSSCKGASSSSVRPLAAKPMGAARSSLPTIAGLASAPALSLSASANLSLASPPSVALPPVPADRHHPTMPDFPDEFTAEFLVIAPENRSMWEVRESFSPEGGVAYTRLLLPTRGASSGVYMYEWFVDWYNQLAYFNTKYEGRDGRGTGDSDMDKYFEGQERCRRLRVGYNLMAANIRSLLLYSPTVPPTFIGNQTVRNVPCGVWALEANGVRVTWFWATSGSVDTTPFHTPGSVQSGFSGYSRLLRMTVVGRGGAPHLFTHHPFFQQGYAFPVTDRLAACRALGPGEGDIGCNANQTGRDYMMVYDIMTFVPYVRRDDYNIPKACDGAKISDSIPSAACHLTSVTGGVEALLLVLIALLFALVSGCCVWCHFSRMVRHQQDELARLTWEIHLAQSANGTDGQDTAIVSAAGGADAKNSSS
ncbi:hypothetical protein LSCM1_01139 [Leishmania martiniquensis]|nr:hypothetical protein LSCM1_01139 [Leishmania martiniquensis]